MIFVLAKFMKQCAEFATLNGMDYNRVQSGSGKRQVDLGQRTLTVNPKNYSMKNLKLSFILFR